MDMIHEIHDTVAIRNFNMKQMNEAYEEDDWFRFKIHN
jgi:hypothetical protein